LKARSQSSSAKSRQAGFYVAPHIFADVRPESRLAQEEIFGPVLAVMRAVNLDEALQIANGVKYALTGGLFSRSPGSIERVRREFRVGNLYINRKITGAVVNRQPFGRVQNVRCRLEGRRAGLSPAVHGLAHDHREHDAARLFSAYCLMALMLMGRCGRPCL